MLSSQMITRSAVVTALGLAAACSDTPNTPDIVDVEFRSQRAPGVSSALASSLFLSAAGGAAISPDTIASLNVTVESIQVLPLLNNAAEGDDAAWMTVPIDPVTLDLTMLPTTDESPLVIASGKLPEGGYTNVRLFVGATSIVFKGPISLGSGINFNGGEEYPVTIPSAAQTGIKTDMVFNAVQNTEVTLVFDEGASYANVTLAGNGVVILAPVIRAPGNNGS